MRVPGSNNPYLSMAACLASGLYGIRNKRERRTAAVGNAYEVKEHDRLPLNLLDASVS
jgi:glutamine synthetase